MSALSERLVKQLLRIRDRELELEMKQEDYDNKVRQSEELQKELEVEQEKLSKLKSVQTTLERMNDESEARYKAVQDDDALQRKQMSEELKRQIAAADESATDLAQREQRALGRKEMLQKQKEIYDEHASSGREKIDELVAKRESQTEALTRATENNVRRAPELRQQLETETADLATATAAQAEVKAKVDEYVERFAAFQAQLGEAKKLYEAASTEKDRSTRTIKALESDAEMLRRRAVASRTERDKELAKLTALEEKAETLRSQTARFDNIAKMLSAPAE
ncbi:hypothetical protein NESM_000222900 [Novymonas esmeraldas]|uniref:Uncharacterized protein n=1 Tax=Novymonas esmeraldas TaxID=1808958 RepID=A0AAW0F5Y0_9TRYP